MEINNNQKTASSDWCYYLVAFLDVLGQKEVFNKLYHIKSGNEIGYALEEEISGNLLYLEKLRDIIKEYFINYRSEEPSQISVDPSSKEQFDEMRRMEIYFQFFSDSIIAFVPLEFRSFYSVRVDSVWGVLGGCCAAVLWSLAHSHAIRGGIEISWGTRLSSGEVYGPVLNKTFYLESEVAKNPRIIVGKKLYDFLNALSDKIPQHRDQTQMDIGYCKKRGDDCLKLISDDLDSKRILDYLGAGFLGLNKDLPEFFEIHDNSKKFVFSCLDKYTRDGNSKLILKYQYLADYFDRRSVIIEEARKLQFP